MKPEVRSIEQRVTEHFATDPDRRDVWMALDLFLDTDAYLNLGYSNWYQPHWLPSSQRRLVDVVGEHLRNQLGPSTEPARILDIGSGRGGPAVRLADRWGFEVVGLDLVGANLGQARENAAAKEVGGNVTFVHGTAARLPLGSGTVNACTAIDSLVYMADTRAVLAEASRVLDEGGLLVLTDLVRLGGDAVTGVEASSSTQTVSGDPMDRVSTFATEWDMPELDTLGDLLSAVDETGFEVLVFRDISARSIRQFRPYTRLYIRLADGRGSFLVRWVSDRFGLDEPTVTRQIRAAHRAIPELAHVLVVAVKGPG